MNRKALLQRGVGFLMLALLGVSGYYGAKEDPVRMVSVPVTRLVLQDDSGIESSRQVGVRLSEQRKLEMDILSKILDDDQAEEELKNNAREQLAGIAARIEVEVLAMDCLEKLGKAQASASCNGRMLTIFLPQLQSGDAEATALIDAVCGVTGYEPNQVKIILTRK